ncbi:uncharacterized protein P174DRAFT_420166 [Aspergillus novofumigatus IBT 16806]|uniref:Uncharacterized protein n=1 Tax=Aspergillus novofumigatus (strain IBT 16806) TaxID=1392255 RepID=A0A2I1C7F6_ASPN1|nr:uncharacterized protein P174DRAFT_420166 [Aspergillus novofumigatus IBT 16806]PKX93568.1 hypothetical protein P174DRAFT_420166 [Aspergillus novofumigatus IBT 16806]
MGIIDEKRLPPKLYKDAAVKVIHWENQWVAYDDEETLEIKAQFALGQDLGGLMTCPMGASRTPSISALSNSSEHIQVKKTIDQCKWTNCGQMCPTGYQAVLRTDKNRHNKEELMLDTTTSAATTLAQRGMVEVGSTQGGCHKGYQAACCTVKATNSMDAWNSCVWAGEPDECKASCPILQNFPQVFSNSGSGAVKCNKG